MILLGGLALVVVLAFHVAWIGKRAEARGRFVLGWVVLGVALATAGLFAGVALFNRADATPSTVLVALYSTAPITLPIAPLIAIVLVLLALPTRVAIGRTWPVFEKLAGAGTLVIEDGAIELRWAGRTDRIARAGLSAEADVETLRLSWHDGTSQHALSLMPTGTPRNREGRVRQAEVLAARLRP